MFDQFISHYAVQKSGPCAQGGKLLKALEPKARGIPELITEYSGINIGKGLIRFHASRVRATASPSQSIWKPCWMSRRSSTQTTSLLQNSFRSGAPPEEANPLSTSAWDTRSLFFWEAKTPWEPWNSGHGRLLAPVHGDDAEAPV